MYIARGYQLKVSFFSFLWSSYTNIIIRYPKLPNRFPGMKGYDLKLTLSKLVVGINISYQYFLLFDHMFCYGITMLVHFTNGYRSLIGIVYGFHESLSIEMIISMINAIRFIVCLLCLFARFSLMCCTTSVDGNLVSSEDFMFVRIFRGIILRNERKIWKK